MLIAMLSTTKQAVSARNILLGIRTTSSVDAPPNHSMSVYRTAIVERPLNVSWAPRVSSSAEMCAKTRPVARTPTAWASITRPSASASRATSTTVLAARFPTIVLWTATAWSMRRAGTSQMETNVSTSAFVTSVALTLVASVKGTFQLASAATLS